MALLFRLVPYIRRSSDRAGKSSSNTGYRGTSYVQIHSKLHAWLSDTLADFFGRPHEHVYAEMQFHNAADFQAACRAVRDLHTQS